MKRIDMWITDKQDEIITSLINQEETLNKSKIVRDALDNYLPKLKENIAKRDK